MKTATKSLPFELGEPRSLHGLTTIPLFTAAEPRVEYVGLDEASARGFSVLELDEAGAVGTLRVANPLTDRVLLYEGEELLGAKQNRIVKQTVLVEAGVKLELPVHCVERGRWSHAVGEFAPAPHAAYPELREAQRHGQGAVWAEVSAKSARLSVQSPTEEVREVYRRRADSLEEYLAAMPRLDGQSGVIVAIAGELTVLDYVSRSDVFAGLYLKLLRGYALSAIERPVARPLRRIDVGRLLGELELAQRHRRPAVGLGEEGLLTEYARGSELVVDEEVVALTAFPRR